jgi:hypothetical protein
MFKDLLHVFHCNKHKGNSMKNNKLSYETFLNKKISGKRIFLGLTLLICCSILVPILFIACEKFEEPGTIYELTAKSTSNDPAITSISPANIAVAGISGRVIKIYGKNLGVKNGTDTDWVYIGGQRAIIKEIVQNTSITIARPMLSAGKYGNKIVLSVTNPKAIDTSSSVGYVVETPGSLLGDYSNIVANMMAVDFDNDESIYIVAGRQLWRNDISGVTLTQLLGTSSLVGDFRGTTDARFGPGSPGKVLYIAVGKNYFYSVRADTSSTTIKAVKSTTIPSVVTKLEFDTDGNLYAGGSEGIFKINTTDGSVSSNLGFAGTVIKQIRIFNNNIYIADSLHIWKCQLGGSTLDPGNPVVDLTSNTGLSSCRISSFAIDDGGNLYLCLKNHPKYSVFVREDDGSITPFYDDENILPKTVEQLVWANSGNLYLISNSLAGATAATYSPNRIFLMKMDRKGAPYLGRNFLK